MQNVHTLVVSKQHFFLGSHFHFFGGQRDFFSLGITFFQNCGLWGFVISDDHFIRNIIQHSTKIVGIKSFQNCGSFSDVWLMGGLL